MVYLGLLCCWIRGVHRKDEHSVVFILNEADVFSALSESCLAATRLRLSFPILREYQSRLSILPFSKNDELLLMIDKRPTVLPVVARRPMQLYELLSTQSL